jgi:2-polyprenyl-6-methoxyphenol hydroxylase-like FAD-dependent oxidoreductase
VRVLIVGAGVAGLGAALGLGRAGHQVTLLDRDPLTAGSDPHHAFALDRRGAPQVRHTHGLLARLTATLRERFPDVLEDLVSAGGVEVDLAQRFADPHEDDFRLRVLLARRTTLEWALRRAVDNETGVTLTGGAGVRSLIGDAGVVRGVRLESGRTVEADTVVAAGGRRAGVVRWLTEMGVVISEEENETGIVYLTRWYRTGDKWNEVMGGEDLVKLGGDLGYLFYLAVPADLGTFSITMAVGVKDDRLRSQLLDPEAFDRAARALPLPAGLVDGLTPDGPVHAMGGLVNRLRRFVDADGRPLVTGFHAAGDAHTCTNPIYGRGCSLALVQATALTDAFGEYPDDPAGRVRAYEKTCHEQSEPWYHLSVQADEGRQRRASGGSPAGPLDRLFAVGTDDPVVGRAILRVVNLLATPADLLADPVVVGRAMELATAEATRENRWLRTGLTRDEMLQVTAA